MASVCSGPFRLAATDLLDSRRATTHWNTVYRLRRIKIAAALHVVVDKRLADLLAPGPQTADALAHAAEVPVETLRRFLRALTQVGLFTEVEEGVFANTEVSEHLRSDVPYSLRNRVTVLDDEAVARGWRRLPDVLASGQPAFDSVNGMGFFDWIKVDPGRSAAMASFMGGIYGPQVEILRRCRQAMPDHGRVLIVEIVLAPGRSIGHPHRLIDLEMMVTLGGKERSEQEFAALLPLADSFSIIQVLIVEARRFDYEGQVSAGIEDLFLKTLLKEGDAVCVSKIAIRDGISRKAWCNN
jgi:O-methyltransferase domain